MVAALRGHDKIIEKFIQAGAHVNLQDDKGRTALTLTTARGHHKCVKIMMKAGADVNIPDIDGNTALIIADK